MRNKRSNLLKLWLVISLTLSSQCLLADDSGEYQASFRANIVGSHGKPTNDVLGFGLSVHRKLSKDWYLGINIDHSSQFDFERPAKLLGINPASEVDAAGTMTTVTAVGEHLYQLDSPNWSGFWSLGGGINEVTLDDAGGPIDGGGRYDIETNAESEFVLLANAGWIHKVGKQWSLRYTLTYQYHFAEWKFRDRISGVESTIDDYDLYGLRVGLSYRFD